MTRALTAVILAGGLATRLGDTTRSTPKALLPVAGRPFLAWQLDRLVRSGFGEALILTGYLGDAVASFVGDGSAFGLRLRTRSDGPVLLGTAGALRHALDALDDDFLVTYGDSYLPFDYSAPLADLRAHPEALGTMSVFPNAGRWDASNRSSKAIASFATRRGRRTRASTTSTTARSLCGAPSSPKSRTASRAASTRSRPSSHGAACSVPASPRTLLRDRLARGLAELDALLSKGEMP